MQCVLIARFTGESDSETVLMVNCQSKPQFRSCKHAANSEIKMFLKTEFHIDPPLRLASCLPVCVGCSFYPGRI